MASGFKQDLIKIKFPCNHLRQNYTCQPNDSMIYTRPYRGKESTKMHKSRKLLTVQKVTNELMTPQDQSKKKVCCILKHHLIETQASKFWEYSKTGRVETHYQASSLDLKIFGVSAIAEKRVIVNYKLQRGHPHITSSLYGFTS